MAVNRNGVHFTIGVTCEIPPSLIKLAIREPEMSGHYFVRRQALYVTRIR